MHLIAIVKNEGRYLSEWLSYYLELGVSGIFIYDNQSSDGTREMLSEISEEFPCIDYVFWPDIEGQSPQVAAYNDFLTNRSAGVEWAAFFDLDEFLVVEKGKKLDDILSTLPKVTAACGVNWLTFGSSDVNNADYEFVTQTFKWGPYRDCANNRHIKTILRPNKVAKIKIHHAEGCRGEYVAPSGTPIVFGEKKGIVENIDHSLMQLNHYQIKSQEEFRKKIARGRAGAVVGDSNRIRNNPEALLRNIDRKEEYFGNLDPSFLETQEYLTLKSIQDKYLVNHEM